MKKKFVYILLGCILTLFTLKILLPDLLYRNFGIFLSDDQIYHFGRAISYCYHGVPWHGWINNLGIEIYPPGSSVLIAVIMNMTNLPVGIIETLVRLLLILVTIFLLFIITSKINRKMAILAPFFGSIAFLITTEISSPAWYATPLSTFFHSSVAYSPGSFDCIVVLMILWACFEIYNKTTTHFRSIVIIILALTAHILIHSEFIWTLLILIIFQFLLVIKGFKDGNEYFKKSFFIYIAIFLSICGSYILYYGNMVNAFLATYGEKNFNIMISHYLGVPIHHIVILFVTYTLLSLLPLITIIRPITFQKLNKVSINRYYAFAFIIVFFYIYIIAASITTYLFMGLYGKGTVDIGNISRIAGPFTLYYGPPYDDISLVSKVVGLLQFILVFFGIVGLVVKKPKYGNIILILFLVTFILSISYIFPKYHFRSFDFGVDLKILMPIIMSFSPFGLKKLKNLVCHVHLDHYKIPLNTIKMTLIVGILLVPSLLSFLTVYMREPLISDTIHEKDVVGIDVGEGPSSIALMKFLDEQVGKYPCIISTPQTGTIAWAYTHAYSVPLKFYPYPLKYGSGLSYWRILHDLEKEVINALALHNITEYAKKYNARYLVLRHPEVVGIEEKDYSGLKTFHRYFPRDDLKPEKYDKYYLLDKVYQNSFDEYVYYYNSI